MLPTYMSCPIQCVQYELGCPRNNQFVFSVGTETQSVSVVFRFVSRNQKTFFSVCFGVSDRYQNTRNKPNFVETNRKNLQKMFSVRGSSKQLIFFSVRTETSWNSICFGCFWVCFSRNQQKNFWVCYGVSVLRNNQNKQNL
jgi:hypothetical protein